jgi:hypothetical protein
VALIGEREIEASVASLEAQQGCEWVAGVLQGGEGELGFPNASLREFLDGDARDCAAVVFAPCGAVFQPRALARLAQALTQFRAAPIAYCDFTFVAADGGEWPVALPAFDYERLLEQGCGALLFALRMDFAREAAASGAADLFGLFQIARGYPARRKHAGPHARLFGAFAGLRPRLSHAPVGAGDRGPFAGAGRRGEDRARLRRASARRASETSAAAGESKFSDTDPRPRRSSATLHRFAFRHGGSGAS